MPLPPHHTHRFFSEFDGKYLDHAEHRYVLNIKAADFTGETYLNLFNEQVGACLSVCLPVCALLGVR